MHPIQVWSRFGGTEEQTSQRWQKPGVQVNRAEELNTEHVENKEVKIKRPGKS